MSGGASTAKITSDFTSVSEQSGSVAGAGGYHIAVDGGVDLKGGVIASSADKDKNFLFADHVTFSDVDNFSNAKSTGFGIALGPTGIPLPMVAQPAEEKDKGKALATLTPAVP